jgi:hypothetical protein
MERYNTVPPAGTIAVCLDVPQMFGAACRAGAVTCHYAEHLAVAAVVDALDDSCPAVRVDDGVTDAQ